MTTYSFSQLEKLWTQEGGSSALAPYAAATAMIESGGNSAAYNPSGASGLMQLIPSNWHLIPGGNRFDGPSNMRGAVLLSQNTLAGLISNWTDWEFQPDGAKYTAAAVWALAKKLAGGTPAQNQPPNASSPPADPAATPAAADLSPAGVLKGAEGLLHGAATVIDYFFGMFGRGQGWRFGFMIVMGVAVIASYKELSAAGTVPSLLPGRN